MIEAILLVLVGAGVALAGFGLGIVYLKTEPYVPQHKREKTSHQRTETDVKRTEKKLNKHFSVINIEEDEAFDKMMDEHEPVVVEEETIGYGVSEPEQAPTQKKFFVCEEPNCSYRGKSQAFADGRHYCKNHAPVGPMKMSD